MDVPSGSRNVAWFALGPHPGQEGSAVIGGHFGIDDGIPFVFYDLDKLVEDDKIYIETDTGETLSFVVRSTSLFDRDADATTVFTSNDGLSHLNLVTCEGIWNKVNDTYPDRRVVFADALPAGALEPTSTLLPGDSPRTTHVFSQFIKSLYATPLEGIVTTALLISITVLIGMTIRRRFSKTTKHRSKKKD